MSQPIDSPRLAWQIHAAKEGRDRLAQAGYPGGRPEHPTGDVAILYAYGAHPGAEIVAWLQPVDSKAAKRLRREAELANRFDRWLRRSWPASLWDLATAWTFYSGWLTHAGRPNWQASLKATFRRDAFLDEFLIASRGWILWNHQLEELIFTAVADMDRARELAAQWVRRPGWTRLAGIVLPNGLKLKDVLTERSFRLANQRVAMFDETDWPVIARIQAIFADAHGGRTGGRPETERISEQFIDELLSRTDIVDVIGRRVPLRKAGDDWAASCPFHDDRGFSFSVSPNKQFYHCFGCGAHGSAIKFVMDYDRLQFVDAVKHLARGVGINVLNEGATAK